MFRLRLRASDMTRLISNTLMIVVVGFSVAFSYLLFQLLAEINMVSSFIGSARAITYLSEEGLFLGLILISAFIVVRKRN